LKSFHSLNPKPLDPKPYSLNPTSALHDTFCAPQEQTLRDFNVTHMNESCQTYQGAMSRVGMGHVTDMKRSCHVHESMMSSVNTQRHMRKSKRFHSNVCYVK